MASIVRPTANRAVHLRILPRPSNIGESREIMRLVSQFGEVEYFKSLKYDTLSAPNASLVIFREEEAARNCMKRCPIRFRMGRAPRTTEQQQADHATPSSTQDQQPLMASRASPTPPLAPTGAWGAPTSGSISPAPKQQSRGLSTHTPPSARLPQPPPKPIEIPGLSPLPPPAPGDADPRVFQLSASPARVHFRDQINMSHFHGSFALDTKSAAQADLAKSVPVIGLSDLRWSSPGKPWRVMAAERERERRGPRRRKSLSEVWDEGQGGGVEGETAVSGGGEVPRG